MVESHVSLDDDKLESTSSQRGRVTRGTWFHRAREAQPSQSTVMNRERRNEMTFVRGAVRCDRSGEGGSRLLQDEPRQDRGVLAAGLGHQVLYSRYSAELCNGGSRQGARHIRGVISSLQLHPMKESPLRD